MDRQSNQGRNDCGYGDSRHNHVYNYDIERQNISQDWRLCEPYNYQNPETRSNRPGKRTRMKDKLNKKTPSSSTQVPQGNTAGFNVHHGPKRGGWWGRPLTNIDSLPYPAEGVEVVYTNDPADAESWLRHNVIDSEACALGLDIEWRPQFISKKNGGTENKTAVLQLAVEDSSLVLHIFHMKSFPKSLSEVLADRKVLKVGSGIKGDVLKLIKDTGMMCDGRVDTQDCAKALGIIQGTGLKNLSKKVLEIDLNKPKRVSLSNWESFPLCKDQITYAALDAWISLKLYIKMKHQLATKNKGSSIKEIIKEPVDIPNSTKSYSCPGCSETLDSKGKFFRHKIRCQLFNATRTKHSMTGDNETKQLSSEQMNSNQKVHLSLSNSIVGCSLDKTVSDVSSNSECSATSVLPEESTEGNVIICPVFECGVKCQGQEGFYEHVRISRHAYCKECGKVFRSKVSRHHRKQHYSETNI